MYIPNCCVKACLLCIFNIYMNMMKNQDVIVSIICVTYNHEPYIRQCLEGFVMQKTDFAFEVLIHDDASTDKTADIIREYEAKYPDLIKPIYQIENQYSKGVKINAIYNYPRAKGKYIAFCEGDDYWIDPLKLQKQVDFLEANPEYSATFSNLIISDERQTNITKRLTSYIKREYNLFDVLSGMMFGIQNICMRKEVCFYASSLNVRSNGDFKIYYSCALHGKIYRLDGSFAVYRLTGKGVASSRSKEEQFISEIKERYDFQKQLNFPLPNALIYSQVKTILQYLKFNGLTSLPYKEIKGCLLDKPTMYIYYTIYYFFAFVKKTFSRLLR